MSGEIEFIDLEPVPEAVESGRRTAHRSDAWNAGAVLGWAAGAALAMVGSWQMIYRITFGSDGTYGVDGWGRLHVHERDAVPAGGHDARLGVVLCCAAALLIAAAVWTAVEPIRARAGTRSTAAPAAAYLGLAGTMLGGGTAATVYLDVQAEADSLATEHAPAFAPPVLAHGPFLWCCLAAVVCGLAGTLARIVAARGPGGASA